MKKFAFVLMGASFDTASHRADFETKGMLSSIRTVNDFDQAREMILELAEEGYGVIELCGAFGKERVDEYIALTGGKVGIGYVVNNPEQNELFQAFFGQ